MSRNRVTTCDCGRPIKVRKSGCYVCEICDRLERKGFTGGPEGGYQFSGVRPRYEASANAVFQDYWRNHEQ